MSKLNILIKLLILLTLLYWSNSGLIFASEEWTKVNSPSTFITSMENVGTGLCIGELDTRAWLNPYNGIYTTYDFGYTWKQLGLKGRGIKDIYYFEGKIYAATYYVVNGTNGFFVSDDGGSTWRQLGPQFSGSKISRDSKTIYFGGLSNGLWISMDNGTTWQQKLGDGSGVYGPEIKEIESTDNITIVSTKDKVYRSIDQGNTWNEITAITGKGLSYFSIQDNYVFGGSNANQGLYYSKDYGINWEKINYFENSSIGEIQIIHKNIYVEKYMPNSSNYVSVVSTDRGKTWTELNLKTASYDKIISFDSLFSNPSFLFINLRDTGLYKLELEKPAYPKFQFLSIPWKTSNNNDLLDNISAYFDHTYPLLGYSLYKEPSSEVTTTTNFFGYKNSEPDIYYTSHNGTDFALPYGTEILAAGSGIATYHYCNNCGNTIKIDHGNGFESIYMHLQGKNLITTSQPVQVNTGEKIGKVGMTGKTTGPHLHFGLIFDQNTNEIFTDDYPSGYIDPFGWLDLQAEDPWKLFGWSDSIGIHQGNESKYLWQSNIPELSIFLNSISSASLGNFYINLNSNVSGVSSPGYNLLIRPYFPAIPSNTQNNLVYVPNTSVLIEAKNLAEETIKQFQYPAEIKIDFAGANLDKVIRETIRIYFLNEINGTWEPLPTILDLINYTAIGFTSHFSRFALLGDKIDSSSPETALIIEGSAVGSYYSSYPKVSLVPKNSLSSLPVILYKIGAQNAEWEEYQEPFEINRDGIFSLLYRSIDSSGDVEPIKETTLIINTKNKAYRSIKVRNLSFTIQ